MTTILAVLLSLAWPARAAELKIEKFEILDKGLMQAEIVKKVENENSPSGTHTVSKNITLLKATSQVPAEIGTRFGFHYRLVGAPEGELVEFKDVLYFPKAGIRDPERKTTFFQEESHRTARIGQTSYIGYLLERDWELVPGDWVYELSYQGKVLAREKFTLKKPAKRGR